MKSHRILDFRPKIYCGWKNWLKYVGGRSWWLFFRLRGTCSNSVCSRSTPRELRPWSISLSPKCPLSFWPLYWESCWSFHFSFCLQLNSSIPLNNREPSLLFQQPSIGRSLELSYQMPCKELVLGGNSRQWAAVAPRPSSGSWSLELQPSLLSIPGAGRSIQLLTRPATWWKGVSPFCVTSGSSNRVIPNHPWESQWPDVESPK